MQTTFFLISRFAFSGKEALCGVMTNHDDSPSHYPLLKSAQSYSL
ncbi:hypothetical protein [Bartonella sp. AP40SXNS]